MTLDIAMKAYMMGHTVKRVIRMKNIKFIMLSAKEKLMLQNGCKWEGKGVWHDHACEY